MWKKEAKFRLGSMVVLLATGALGSLSGVTPAPASRAQIIPPVPMAVRDLFKTLSAEDPKNATLEVDAAEEAEALNSGSRPEPWKLSR